MERALRLHRGEQGLVCSLHGLRACVHKGLIATVSPGSLDQPSSIARGPSLLSRV